MNKKKLFILAVLAVFVVGMTMGTAAASHTIKCGKYKATISDKKYNTLKKVYKGETSTSFKSYHLKTKSYKKVKVPIYKKKKVTKTKWKYKTVLESKTVYNSDYSDMTEYDYDTDKYYNNGWTYYGYKSVEENDGHVYKYYAKFKKNVKYTTTKKVKTGKYKTVKKPIYIVTVVDNSPYGMAQAYYTGADGEDKFIGKEKRLRF